MTFQGRDLWNWPVESSHILYAQELHWRLAAKWNNMEYDRFIEYEGDEQARMVAAYETAMQIDAVLAADNARKAKRKNKRR